MDLCDLRQIKPLLTRHGFHFSKSMGQNFLIDRAVPERIAEASGAGAGKAVLEIGPGIGTLTEQLAHRAEKVISVEIDRGLLPILAQTLAEESNVEILSGDIMKMDLGQIVETHFGGLEPIVCANLPYNITTPVLTRLLESGLFHSITVMIQREVARRICARPGTGDYGAFTILCQYYADGSILFDVPPDRFYPAPKVTSTVIRLELRSEPSVLVPDRDFFFQTVRGAFSQRRKQLLNGLTSAFSRRLEREQIRQAIAASGFPETVRGEQLSIADFAVLSEQLRNRMADGLSGGE